VRGYNGSRICRINKLKKCNSTTTTLHPDYPPDYPASSSSSWHLSGYPPTSAAPAPRRQASASPYHPDAATTNQSKYLRQRPRRRSAAPVWEWCGCRTGVSHCSDEAKQKRNRRTKRCESESDAEVRAEAESNAKVKAKVILM
jgi:hypothetical protein